MNMKRVFIITTFLVFFTTFSTHAEQIKSNNVSVRTNPGAFYPVIMVLNTGENVQIIESNDPWKKIKTSKGTIGWVSANAFTPVSQGVDYGLLAKADAQKGMSKIMVTAAVKGFYEAKIKDETINKEVFERPFISYVNPFDYEKFVEETYRNRWSRSKFQRKTSIKKTGPFTVDEDLIALSSYICGRLAAPGLSNNRALVAYVNNVAQLIMENTEFYDLPICVHVVKSDQIFANATPIGVIMISEGMLNIVKSENELACLLGHEIAHVALHHGAKEMKIRQPKIRAESAFDELGEELGFDEEEKDLNELCNELYEKAIRGRSAEYEYEADQRGMIYATRAGYDPQGMISLLNRLKTKISVSRNPENASHWLPAGIDRRITKLSAYSSKTFTPNKQYVDLQVRFKIYVRN